MQKKSDVESGQSPAIMTASNAEGANSLKLLVFDMGHVFVDFDWEEVCAGFCRVSSKSREELARALNHCSKLGYESGKIDTAGFLAELNQWLGIELSLDEFRKLWVASFHENEEMAELLGTLKEQRPLYLLSNTNEVHYDHLQEQFDVARHFDELILSYKVGSAKPEHPIYHEVLKRSGLSAEHCLFVDDLEANIKAAQEVGLQTIHFKGAADLKERLSELGFKVSR
ncbi:MAG: HAD family phosphatase [Candidatus Obscuribacterales bacterium]|nr:HAD family phosphatase [Candidatus Obscuribacterales bacterium]